jgi:hypothetical protein
MHNSNNGKKAFGRFLLALGMTGQSCYVNAQLIKRRNNKDWLFVISIPPRERNLPKAIVDIEK